MIDSLMHGPRAGINQKSQKTTKFLIAGRGGLMDIQIVLVNWEKHNPKRKDIIKNSWFRLYHNFFEHPDFYSFSFEERCIWIAFLCEASKANKQNGSFTVNHEYFHRVHGFSSTAIKNTIKKLQRFKCIEVRDASARYASVTNPLRQIREDKSREEEIREENYLSTPAKNRCRGAVAEFSFDQISKALLEGVDQAAQHTWIAAYPMPGKEWLIEQFRLAKSWIDANPRRAPKNIQRFLNNWLSNGYERWRKTQPANQSSEDRYAFFKKEEIA